MIFLCTGIGRACSAERIGIEALEKPGQGPPTMLSSASLASGTGPETPRQATGPPRSGAGVGVGMLRGAGIPLLIFGISKIYQAPTIVKFRFCFGKPWEDTIVLDPIK